MSEDSGLLRAAESDPRSGATHLTRRQFLVLAGSASAAALLAACSPAGTPAPATGPSPAAATSAPQVSTGGGELKFLNWTNFVPEMDTKFDDLAKAWGAQNKVTLTVEHININDIPTRRAAAVQAKSGPDMIWDTQNWPQFFADNLVDVSDIAGQLDKNIGGFFDVTRPYVTVDGKFRAIPAAFGTGTFIHRTDMFKQNNVTVPKTWDEFMKTAAIMKKFGKPFGQTLGHSFGDPPGFWYPWLWAWGGKEVEADGKTVAINSPETITAIEKAVELYKTGLVEAGLAWDDSSNNRSYAGEEISCTANGASIYFVAQRDAAKGDAIAKRVYENSDHFVHPSGPAGQFSNLSPYSIGIMSYSKNAQAAKDFLLWLMQPAQYDAWMDSGKGYLQGTLKGYQNASAFKTDPKLKPFLEVITNGSGHWVGWPGPLSAQSFRVYTNYYIVDMFAKACAGEFTPKAAAAWAEGNLKTAYKA